VLARPQALRRTVGPEDVVHQLDRGTRRHPEQDLLPGAPRQRVGPVHRPGAQIVAVPSPAEAAQAGGQGVAAGVAVLIDEPDLAQRAQDAVRGGPGEVQRRGHLRERQRAPGTAEQAQHRGGPLDRLDGPGHRLQPSPAFDDVERFVLTGVTPLPSVAVSRAGHSGICRCRQEGRDP
jgi:hypothetical protein